MKNFYVSAYLIGAVLCIACMPLYGDYDFKPIFKPELTISEIREDIKIDGKLVDAGWTKAAGISRFTERRPRDLAEPDVKTEAFITYNEDNLYIAFICHDDPGSLRATMCQRDQMSGDDNVCVLIDTECDGQRAYEFFVNPYGIQKDQLWSSVAGEDASFDLIWESASQITDSGYQVEIAIPFTSLHFSNRTEHTWKIDFWRSRPRESYNQYSWAAYDRNDQCWVCQWGTVHGIRDVQPGKGVEILPAIVANQSGNLKSSDAGGTYFDNGDISGELSVGGKYSPASNITIEVAYNPDFSQIEADAAQVDVNTTFALFYPERRPFFQEGSDLFRTLFNSFYTRTINDPQFTAKVIARMGSTNIAALSAVDENTPYIIPLREESVLLNTGRSYVNIVRGLRTVWHDSRVGFLLSDRRFENDGAGTVMALDYDLRLSRNYSIDAQYIGTYTKEGDDYAHNDDLGGLTFDDGKHTVALDGESYYGTAFISRFRRSARSWNFMVEYNQISPTYRTEIGYDPINSHRTSTQYTYYVFRPKSDIFESITPFIYNEQRWEFNGDTRHHYVSCEIDCQSKIAQTYAQVSYGRGYQVYNGVWFDKLWEADFYLSGRFGPSLAYSLYFEKAVDIAYYYMKPGNGTGVQASLTLKPIDRLIIEPRYTYTRMRDKETDETFYDGYIFRSRFQFQLNRQVSLRLVLQYNDFYETWDVDPLLTYRLNSFSVFYLGSTYDYDNYISGPNDRNEWKLSSRQFFMKLQYLFRA